MASERGVGVCGGWQSLEALIEDADTIDCEYGCGRQFLTPENEHGHRTHCPDSPGGPQEIPTGEDHPAYGREHTR